ncbi:MAG: hypothetical protein ABI585_05025, partial [Betaproteobacteria bacterium]
MSAPRDRDEHAGKPAVPPQPDRGARVASDSGAAPLPSLPHERDERAGKPAAITRPLRLAAEDLEDGRVDTDCRGRASARECAGEIPALLKPRPATGGAKAV